MSRVIKFRAWDEQAEVIHLDVEFIRSGVEGNDWIIFKSDRQTLENGNVLNNPYFAQQIKLMQSIGITDKNGADIYEGDGARIHHDDGESNYEGVVTYEPESCAFGMLAGDTWSWFEQIDGRNLEVIGNIHENPGLLEVKP
jgi:uncharacterized phage protein (TIGR01671 family)